MNTSKFISKVLGIYCIVISIAFLSNMHHMQSIINSMLYNPAIMLFAGITTLILGTLMVVSHNFWHLKWYLLVTIISWIVFLKGLSLVLFPHVLDKLSLFFIQNLTFAYIIMSIDLILGLILCYFGFRKN